MVPVEKQRIYFRAKELNLNPKETLKECQLENNHVVKLVGEPSKLVHPTFYGRSNTNLKSQQVTPDFQGQYNQPQYLNQFQPR